VGSKPGDRVEAFFDDLCVTYGWCLQPAEREIATAALGDDLDGFVDSVIGVYTDQDPAYCDRSERQWVTSLARKWLFEADGSGA